MTKPKAGKSVPPKKMRAVAAPNTGRNATSAAITWSSKSFPKRLMPASALTHRISGAGDFVYLMRPVAPDVAERVAALRIKGVHDETEYWRYYPKQKSLRVYSTIEEFLGWQKKNL